MQPKSKCRPLANLSTIRGSDQHRRGAREPRSELREPSNLRHRPRPRSSAERAPSLQLRSESAQGSRQRLRRPPREEPLRWAPKPGPKRRRCREFLHRPHAGNRHRLALPHRSEPKPHASNRRRLAFPHRSEPKPRASNRRRPGLRHHSEDFPSGNNPHRSGLRSRSAPPPLPDPPSNLPKPPRLPRATRRNSRPDTPSNLPGFPRRPSATKPNPPRPSWPTEVKRLQLSRCSLPLKRRSRVRFHWEAWGHLHRQRPRAPQSPPPRAPHAPPPARPSPSRPSRPWQTRPARSGCRLPWR